MFTNLSSTRRLSSYDEEEPEQTEEEKQKERNEAKEQCRFNRGCTLGLNNEGKRENLADWCSKKVTLWEEFHEKAYALIMMTDEKVDIYVSVKNAVDEAAEYKTIKGAQEYIVTLDKLKEAGGDYAFGNFFNAWGNIFPVEVEIFSPNSNDVKKMEE